MIQQFLGIHKIIENSDFQLILYTHVHSSIFHNSQKVEATQVPINKWIDKQNMVFTYNGILFSLENKEILPHDTTWINFEDIILSEISQSHKKPLYDSTYMRLVKQIHRNRK